MARCLGLCALTTSEFCKRANDQKDLPFPQLEGIRKRVRVENARINEVQRKFESW
jgi:hypothetical protein